MFHSASCWLNFMCVCICDVRMHGHGCITPYPRCWSNIHVTCSFWNNTSGSSSDSCAMTQTDKAAMFAMCVGPTAPTECGVQPDNAIIGSCLYLLYIFVLVFLTSCATCYCSSHLLKVRECTRQPQALARIEVGGHNTFGSCNGDTSIMRGDIGSIFRDPICYPPGTQMAVSSSCREANKIVAGKAGDGQNVVAGAAGVAGVVEAKTTRVAGREDATSGPVAAAHMGIMDAMPAGVQQVVRTLLPARQLQLHSDVSMNVLSPKVAYSRAKGARTHTESNAHATMCVGTSSSSTAPCFQPMSPIATPADWASVLDCPRPGVAHHTIVIPSHDTPPEERGSVETCFANVASTVPDNNLSNSKLPFNRPCGSSRVSMWCDQGCVSAT